MLGLSGRNMVGEVLGLAAKSDKSLIQNRHIVNGQELMHQYE